MTIGVTLTEAQAAKGQAFSLFQKLAGNVAVGIVPLGKGLFGLKVNLVEAPAAQTAFPTQVNGVPVRVEVTGAIRKR